MANGVHVEKVTATSSGLDESQGAIRAMLSKDKTAYRITANDYSQHWDDKGVSHETDEVRRARADAYAELTGQYYDISTDVYEHAWGESFHFCRFARGESFAQAIARHEHYLAACIGIRRNMQVLDVGCGVGGPAREMVTFTGCRVTGLNISEYQLKHARAYGERNGLSHRLDFVQGDFMKMPFPDASFDAVYSVEATVHAPSLRRVYSEIHRVLKPGGRFGIYEWVMTDAFDNENIDHRRIRLAIEKGYGIAAMVKMSDALAALQESGLELESEYDLAVNEGNLDVAPWYWPMGGDMRHAQTVWDVLSLLKKNRYGAMVTARLLGLLETVGIAPAGIKRTVDSMGEGADALVTGGKQGLFTPMYLMVGRKPYV
ncbi:Uu.00g091020.m01.CDS01 [Anthostomella pinea]|uniref:Sterol 24-C-methyltransferase n=1 Tax=Anthostomella pinea TaxID=933095 RepID=A0AAI8VNY5_9PEZI|nr:Uu.00g091020.m01.CDS01 [Anthostomella pinea]